MGHLMRTRDGLACHLHRDAFALAQPRSLRVIGAEDPGRRGHGFQVPVQYSGVQEDAPERPASGPGQRGPPYPWPFRTPSAPLPGKGGDSPPGGSTARTEVKAILTSWSVKLRISCLKMLKQSLPMWRKLEF